MQPCTICRSPRRAEIDRQLVERVPLRRIAEQCGTSVTALHRHSHAHVAQSLTQAKQASEVADADSLLGRVEQLISRSQRIAERAERAKQWSPAVAALREVRCCLELLAELQGELRRSQTNQTNVYLDLSLRSQEELNQKLCSMIIDLFERDLFAARMVGQALLAHCDQREGVLDAVPQQ
jgi:hypothetical protein